MIREGQSWAKNRAANRSGFSDVCQNLDKAVKFLCLMCDELLSKTGFISVVSSFMNHVNKVILEFLVYKHGARAVTNKASQEATAVNYFCSFILVTFLTVFFYPNPTEQHQSIVLLFTSFLLFSFHMPHTNTKAPSDHSYKHML